MFCLQEFIIKVNQCRQELAYGKAGNRNETESGNGNWKQKWGQKMHQSLVQYFLHSVFGHYSSILLSNHYGTAFMSHALLLLLYCAL